MTIPLPPLPEPDFALDQGDEPCYYAHTIRAIQREAMRVAIEAAARVCEEAWPEMHKYWGPGQARAACEDCASAIRALEIGT